MTFFDMIGNISLMELLLIAAVVLFVYKIIPMGTGKKLSLPTKVLLAGITIALLVLSGLDASFFSSGTQLAEVVIGVMVALIFGIIREAFNDIKDQSGGVYRPSFRRVAKSQ